MIKKEKRNLKKIKRALLILSVLIVLCLLMTSCGEEDELPEDLVYNDDGNIELYASVKFLDFAELTPEEFIDRVNERAGGHEVSAVVNDDGRTGTVIYAPEEYEYWHAIVTEELETLRKDMVDHFEKYRVDYAADYSTIRLYANKVVSNEEIMTFLKNTSYYCALGQLIKGNKNWDVWANIYNCDTQKLVRGGNLVEGIKFDDKHWQDSYELSQAEEANVRLDLDYTECVTFIFDSTVKKPLDVMDQYHDINGSDYTYMYLNNSGYAVIGLNKEELEHTEERTVQALDKEESDFENTGEGYYFEYSDDFIELDFYLTQDVDREALGDRFEDIQTLCMMMQKFNSSLAAPATLKYRIHDLETEDILSEGASTQWSSWKLGRTNFITF